ncbi:MAG: hypothetical protein IPM79_36705 [Polyangiaceae bacterium]|jgi:hypothetical protein|nr:hypothetical protein [Polyangiaceae bacterium]
MRVLRPWALGGLILVASLNFSVESSAQGGPLPGDIAVAKAKEALKHYEAAEWAEAFELFSQADAAAHSVVFRLYMARAKRNLGKLLEARTLYRGIGAEQLPADALPSWVQAQADAKAELASLEPTIPKLIVQVTGASPAATVEIGGVKAAPGEPVQLDPGEHTVVAKDGAAIAQSSVTVRAGDPPREVSLSLTAVGDTSVVAPGPIQKKTLHVEGPLAPGIALAVSGGAGLIVGAVLGGLALDKDGYVTEQCPNGICPVGTDRGDIEDAQEQSQTFANASTGLLIAGGALAAVGVVLIVVRPGGEDVEVAPSVSLGPGFVSLGWRFE